MPGKRRWGTSPEGTTESIPQIPFVKFNPVFLQQRQKLLLKTLFTMMLLLILNVIDNGVQLRNADAEGAVFFLPRKEPLIGKILVNPFRGTALDKLHSLGNGQGCRQGQ